ncbi:MAG TPA: thiamine-binding protein [Acidimicrobiales bacterium]|nr:thiamine-binding protein [Acidimicrobiales bacterium]
MTVTVEFTVEPFTDGAPGPHVQAAVDAASATGGVVDVGPFGTTLTGPAADVVAGIPAVVDAALAHGATRITVQVSAS